MYFFFGISGDPPRRIFNQTRASSKSIHQFHSGELLVSPELIDYSENDYPADQEDSQERKRIPVSAVQKIADGEEGGPNHRAACHPSDQSQWHAVAGVRNFCF